MCISVAPATCEPSCLTVIQHPCRASGCAITSSRHITAHARARPDLRVSVHSTLATVTSGCREKVTACASRDAAAADCTHHHQPSLQQAMCPCTPKKTPATPNSSQTNTVHHPAPPPPPLQHQPAHYILISSVAVPPRSHMTRHRVTHAPARARAAPPYDRFPPPRSVKPHHHSLSQDFRYGFLAARPH